MKYCFTLCFCLFAVLLDAQNIVTISGKIQNKLSDTVVVTYNDNLIAYYTKTYFAVSDEKGNFKMSFPVPENVFTQAEIKHGNRLAEIIIRAGDSLVLNVNTLYFDSTIKYTGKGSEINNFIAVHTFKIGRINQYALRIKECLNYEQDEFLNKIDKELQSELSFLKTNNKHLPTEFVNYWTLFHKYYNYFFIEQYPQVHQMLKLRRFTDTIPETNYKLIEKLPVVFNDSFLQLPPYLLYLTGITEIKLKAKGFNAYIKDTFRSRIFLDSVNKLAIKNMPSASAEYYLAQGLYTRIKHQSVERTKYELTNFKNKWSNSKFLSLLENQFAIAEKLAPGQPAPDFDIYATDGKNYKLSDFRGNVIYLEFWAGWCKQCIGEMLREQKMKDLLNNKPLKFIYASIGNDTAAENTIIKKYKLEGIFCNINNGWMSNEVKDYGVQSLPAYYLIDEDGNFALQDPPSPMQSTQLILEIEKLFK